MTGWAQLAGPSPAALLAGLSRAVDAYLASPTTGNLGLLRAARERVERAERQGW